MRRTRFNGRRSSDGAGNRTNFGFQNEGPSPFQIRTSNHFPHDRGSARRSQSNRPTQNHSKENIQLNVNRLPNQSYGGDKRRWSQVKCEEVLKEILSNNEHINSLLTNGQLLPLLNSSHNLNRAQVHHLLSSINLFTTNENSPRSIQDLFIMILNSECLSATLEPLVKQYFLSPPNSQELEIMIYFFINCLELLPSQFVEKMSLLYPSVQFCIQQFSSDSIQLLANKLTKCLECAKKKIETEKLKSPSLQLTQVTGYDVNNFRNFSVIPQPTDIFCLDSEVHLRPNKVADKDGNTKSTYDSVDDYLDTQFCLLKEDFVRPLRDGIAAVRVDMLIKPKVETKKLQIRLYDKVTIEDMFTSRNGMVYRVIFDVSKFRKIDWKKAKRFIYGSLLCFTNNFFETLHFASVIEADPKSLEKGILVVQFNEDPISEVLENNEFIMIETKNLFEAYRHVLTKLQTFTTDTLPFKNFIVFGENVPQSPAFMTKNDIRMITIEGDHDADFDESQKYAFISALKSNLSLIQGPPGTGKTYVGLKIIKYLVNNFQIVNRNIGPMLVVCYTNHALDQFLQDIIGAIGIENVIRVGGRSKLEIMKECNISTIKWRWVKKRAFAPSVYKRGIEIRREIELAEETLVRKYVCVKNYDKRLLSYNDLYGCLSHSHMKYFQTMDFNRWIRGGDSMLNDIFVNYSNLKASIMKDLSDRCITDFVKGFVTEVVGKLLGEVTTVEEENYDDMVEDPDDVLNDERFLDGDMYILKNSRRFQDLYDKVDDDFLGADVDDEGFKHVANIKLIKNKLKRTKPLTEEEYTAITTLDMDYNIRLRLYKYWLEKYRIILIEEYFLAKAEFDILSKEREEISFQEYIAIMKSVKVIGMTTTGASRYGSVLERVGCRVVVIEEAAEVLESHVVCALSERCDQLIMIGDHKQLRPKVDVYELETDYNLGISLFERLIGNQCQYSTLQYQHRMRPDISVCVKPIYPELLDSDNVFHYDSIAGMNTDIYFFNHKNFEIESIETSYKNDFEADFVAKLCEYLIKSGNLPKNITVLTLYSGQLYNISNRMKQQMFRGIRICVLDNYQGEENEIIILSLVRSNANDIVGFVKSENRLCVTLSRAKRGFYVIGNFAMLCRKIPLLKNIVDNHLDKKSLGNTLPLKCLMHPDENNYVIRNIEDFSKKGCPSKCGMQLECGHSCEWSCHRNTPSHKTYSCRMPCEKVCDRDLHRCKLLCFQKCKCQESVLLVLACGHEHENECHQTQFKCMELCDKILTCMHKCLKMCHEKCKCEMVLDKVLDCAHQLDVECGTDISKVKCPHVCDKSCPCGHQCKEKCFQRCVCSVLIEHTFPCSHKIKIRCGTDMNQARCTFNVEKQFECGHSIAYECFNNIERCGHKVDRMLLCGHMAKVACGDAIETLLCTQLCGITQDCHHKCQGKCGECLQGQLHVLCKAKCKKFLRCGHYCDRVCHAGFCLPCDKPCKKYCIHSQCTLPCGYPCECQPCQLVCTKSIKCTKCQKKEMCSKHCGESCAKLCNVCLMTAEINNAEYYIVERCNCYVLKEEFNPQLKIADKDVSLVCQICQRYIQSPYSGVVLTYFKQQYSVLFQQIAQENVLQWIQLFKDFKALNYLPDNCEEICATMNKTKIYQGDMGTFNTAFEYYQEIMETCKTMSTIKGEANIEKYHKKIKKILFVFIKWLNPFSRTFGPKETELIKLEKSRLSLGVDILRYLHCLKVTDYALVHKQLFEQLELIDQVTNIGEMETLYSKMEEIKRNLYNTKESTKEEEQLVERILTARDIYKEFNMENLSVEDKLKKIKKLIVRCHPDKNKSQRANEAVQLLLAKKKLLE